MQNFTQLFEIIYNKFCKFVFEAGIQKREISQLAMARFLNVSQGKMQAWQRGQWPSAPDLANIATKLGFSYRWLVTGEGDPEGDDSPPIAVEQGTAAPDNQDVAALHAEIARLKEEVETLQKELIEEQRHSLKLMREALTLSRAKGAGDTEQTDENSPMK